MRDRFREMEIELEKMKAHETVATDQLRGVDPLTIVLLPHEPGPSEVQSTEARTTSMTQSRGQTPDHETHSSGHASVPRQKICLVFLTLM